MSPFNAFLILRGVLTLPMRVRRHSENAMQVAGFLARHPAVRETRYPGLAEDPGHGVAAGFLDRFGGMVGFAIRRGAEGIAPFRSALRLCKPWTSLGDVETLIQPHDRDDRRGIPDGYVRLSVGLEDPDDIIADLDQALKQAE